MDAKDILGLPKNSFPVVQEKKSRPREQQRKPDGISREVYALTGGVPPPLVPSIEISNLKKRPPTEKEKITWQWLAFTNSARTDNLQLYHWGCEWRSPTGDYTFAKYNKSVDIIKYTDAEYKQHLTDPNWTKEETDQLFEMCECFDLRFIIIADRFLTSRTVEELKSRYYFVSRAILLARAGSYAEVSGHPLVKENFNITHEIERKRALSTVLSRTKQQERRDAEVIAEAKRIIESRASNKGAEPVDLPEDVIDTDSIEKATVSAEAASPLSTYQTSAAAVTPLSATIEAAATPASLRMLRVYLRTHVLDQMVQAANSTAGLRTIKRVDQTLQDLGVHLKPKVPTKAVCAEHLELRKEILTLLNLQKQLQNKEAEASGIRDNSYAETPGTPKRFNRDYDRPFVPDSAAFGGERVSKKDHKRKGSGRYADAPPSPPQSKRPRKLKTSDM